MKQLFDKVSFTNSKTLTRTYSTSFSMGIRFFKKQVRQPIYSIYGFVRLGDEIVDTFHDYNKEQLFEEFKKEVYQSIERKISLNPILNSFQWVVNKYHIDKILIEQFLKSMEMDLYNSEYNQRSYEDYILGSAEVVGLMCLKVFVNGDEEHYNKLKMCAMKLGSAYQKVNFLRDLQSDYNELGRTYFPELNINSFNDITKQEIIDDIEADFQEAYPGIKALPRSARFGVFISYIYYLTLLKKIRRTPPSVLLHKRIRISNARKYMLLFNNAVRYKLKLI